MPKKQYPHEYVDAKGNTIVHNKDGTSEMYIGGRDAGDNWIDVSDQADRAVKRKRLMPVDKPFAKMSSAMAGPTVATRESTPLEDELPGNVDLDE